ncbi:hypothetical protein ACTDI4_01570 [Mesorhizobium sp. PUT5]|uniref:hypothetical protein n=1 Tax=Mesorhizobium sp. PUT5 TaxID=3454629 RepID=UPI003FA46577
MAQRPPDQPAHSPYGEDDQPPADIGGGGSQRGIDAVPLAVGDEIAKEESKYRAVRRPWQGYEAGQIQADQNKNYPADHAPAGSPAIMQ